MSAGRHTGVLVKRYAGDPTVARTYLGVARTLLGRMIAYLGPGISGAKQWNLPNGVLIRTQMSGNTPIVEIDVRGMPIPSIHGLFCVPQYDEAPSSTVQDFQRALFDENWVPFVGLQQDTAYVGGNIDWSGLDRRDRLTFHGPYARYSPVTFNMSYAAQSVIYPYLADEIAPSVTVPQAVLGASIYRFVDGGGIERRHFIVSTIDLIFTSMSLPYTGVLQVKFYWRPVDDVDALGWQVINTHVFASAQRLATMTMFNRAGNKCCGVTYNGQIVEWSFEWTGAGYSVSSTSTIPAAGTSDSTVTETYTSQLTGGPPTPYTTYRSRLVTSSTAVIPRAVFAADYIDETVRWLYMEFAETTASDRGMTLWTESFQRTYRVLISDGTVIYTVSGSVNSTTTFAGFDYATSVSYNDGGGILANLFVSWADVRSKSVLLEHAVTEPFSFSRTNATPSVSTNYTYAQPTDYATGVYTAGALLTTRNSFVYDVNVVATFPISVDNGTYEETADDRTGQTETSTSHQGVTEALAPQMFFPFTNVETDRPMWTCTPIQCEDGVEFFLSLTKGHVLFADDEDQRNMLPNPFSVLFLDNALRSAEGVFGVADTTEFTNPRFTSIGSV